jgi:hypothetical protein
VPGALLASSKPPSCLNPVGSNSEWFVDPIRVFCRVIRVFVVKKINSNKR